MPIAQSFWKVRTHTRGLCDVKAEGIATQWRPRIKMTAEKTRPFHPSHLENH